MYSIEYILNKDVTLQKLQTIINIKTIAWPYPYDSQIKWIQQNLSPLDIHVILYKENTPVAYLNLKNTYMKVNGSSSKVYGVGNVCAVKKHKGYGKVLMENVNSFIKTNCSIGLLFCKQPLLNFYSNLGWVLCKEENISHSHWEKNEIKVLTFNIQNVNSKIEYTGQLF